MKPTEYSIVYLCLGLIIISSGADAYLNIQQYCRSFDENFQPIICILKNKNGTTNVEAVPVHNHPVHRPRPPRPQPQPVFPIIFPVESRPPPPPDYYDNHNHHHEEDEDECSCDLTCFPVIANQNGTGVNYRCRSCGSSCTIKSSSKVRCSCAVPSGNATCACSATCASFRMGSYTYDDSEESSEDSNCIFTISSLVDRRIGEEQRPYNCECCKSKEAENTSDPDFVCICQRVSASGSSPSRQRLGHQLIMLTNKTSSESENSIVQNVEPTEEII